MTNSVSKEILTICRVLNFYANRLSGLRANTSKEQASLGYLSKQDMNFEWFDIIDPIYNELEGLMQKADIEQVEGLLTDAEIVKMLPALHMIRGAYEFDKEVSYAKKILNKDRPLEYLTEIIEEQKFWTLSEAVLKELNGVKKVAVIGSGALPLTALTIAMKTDCEVFCFERDQKAYDLGLDVINLFSGDLNIQCTKEEARGETALGSFDVIFSAVLLGVSLESQTHDQKSSVIEKILSKRKKKAPIILRDPYLLGSLFYPPIEADKIQSAEINRYDPNPLPSEPYRSSYLIIK